MKTFWFYLQKQKQVSFGLKNLTTQFPKERTDVVTVTNKCLKDFIKQEETVKWTRLQDSKILEPWCHTMCNLALRCDFLRTVNKKVMKILILFKLLEVKQLLTSTMQSVGLLSITALNTVLGLLEGNSKYFHLLHFSFVFLILVKINIEKCNNLKYLMCESQINFALCFNANMPFSTSFFSSHATVIYKTH